MKTTFKIVAASFCTFSFLPAQQSSPSADDMRFTQASYSSFFEAEEREYVPIAEREWNRPTVAPVRPIGQKEETFTPAGTISFKALQNPISAKSRKLVEKAEGQVREHDYAAATKTLSAAMTLEDARPYALALSGSMKLTQYIRTNDPQTL